MLVLVVSHTHWDREWYHGVGRFRQRLVALVDELLDVPPEARLPFLLDGQAIVLEDYLDVRPERAPELAAALREGRLEAGPWYVLADELLPGGESLVRNLLEGRATLRRLGAEAPPVLYSPDAFGHAAALPMLAAGFGLPVVVA
jgi:alpha-mannosidase